MFGFSSHDYNAGRRYTIDEQAAYFPGWHSAARPKTCTKHNRLVIEHENGDKAFCLHQTRVVTLHPDGSLTFDDGGYATMTTRRAMAEGIKELTGRDCYIWGNKPATAHTAGLGIGAFNCPHTTKVFKHA